MRDTFRFLMGLGIFFIILLGVTVLLFVLIPFIIAGGLVFMIIAGIATAAFSIAWLIALVWFVSRREPPLGKKNFSIKQGKEV